MKELEIIPIRMPMSTIFGAFCLMWSSFALAGPRAIVVVDPFSSGAFYRQIIKERDPSVAVIAVVPEVIPDLFIPSALKGQSQEIIREKLFGEYEDYFIFGHETSKQIREKGYSVLDVYQGTETAPHATELLLRDFQIPERNDPATSSRRRNKLVQNQIINGVDSPILGTKRFAEVRSFGDIRDFLVNDPEGGIVLKVTEGAGSNNMAVFRSRSELGDNFKNVEAAYEKIRRSTDIFGNPANEIIVEEFIRGREFQANALVANGEIFFTSFVKAYKEGVVPEHDQFLPFHGELQAQMREVVSLIPGPLGISRGTIHPEIFQGDDGKWYIGEVANRPAGSGIPLIEHAISGTSQMHENVRYTLDRQGFLRNPPRTFLNSKTASKVAIRYFGPEATVKGIDLRQIESLQSFHSAIPHYQIEDRIRSSSSLTDLLMLVWLVGDPNQVTEDRNFLRRWERQSPSFRSLSQCMQMAVSFGL